MMERNTVRAVFDHLRLTLEKEVPRQLEHPEGGHYVVALLVAIGSEALSTLLDHKPNHVFVKMMTKHGVTPTMAATLFRAMRNGIAHFYETNYVKAGPLEIELSVSWGQKTHLSVHRAPPILYLNVRTMWEDLQAELTQLAVTLPVGGELPRQWVKDAFTPADHDAKAWHDWIARSEEGVDQ